MPRQRKRYRRELHAFPADFPQRLERLKEESGLTWSELAARLGTSPLTLRRWRQGVCPNALHLLALMEVAASLGLAQPLPVGNDRRRGQGIG